jgi:outer membrane biosynthesis protein TonB
MAACLLLVRHEPYVAPGGKLVKTRIQSFSFLATLAVALGIVSWGSALNAQSTPSTPSDQQQPQAQQPSPQPPSPQQPQTPVPPDNTQQPPSSAAAPDQAQEPNSKSAGTPAATDSREFLGTVVKQGDKYVLQDDAGHTYDIDRQDEVKKIEGKRVRVKGVLDDSQKKILVK